MISQVERQLTKFMSQAEREAYIARDFWWPIPQAEIDLNKGRIIQNDGWK